MNLACQILASSLLICIVSTEGAAPKSKEVWGTVGHGIDLNIPDFQINDDIDHIEWHKGKEKYRVAQLKSGKFKGIDGRYNISRNGALKIKHLNLEDSDTYSVVIYTKSGKNLLEKRFNLTIQEEVSEPVMSWSCIKRNLTCEIKSGTNPELTLHLDDTALGNAAARTISRKIATNRWTTKRSMLFNCTAKNQVSKQSRGMTINCSAKGLDIYLIVSICGGGIIFIIFMTLLIFYINKRRRHNSRRNDEELEVRTRRVTTKERCRKPGKVPGSAPQNPAVSQPPPPPSHRPQAPGPRPPPPSHRAQHHPQRKAPPPSATQVHQQKGPPLPRPRVQPKPPHGATENS